MKVYRPSKNKINGGFTSSHPAYDFDDQSDPNVYSSMSGRVVLSVNKYDTHWRNLGALTTADYGNFVKVLHDDGSSEIHAHLKYGSPIPVGTRVDAKQKIGEIGHTGNSTGPHLHYEFRDKNGNKLQVEFIDWDEPIREEKMIDPLYEYLGVKNFDEAKNKLKGHLGEEDQKCDWGNADNNRGGDLGSARRRVLDLENENQVLRKTSGVKLTRETTVAGLTGEINGWEVTVGNVTANYKVKE